MNNNRSKASESSTKYATLSRRVNNIKKELSPGVSCTGKTLGVTPKQWVTRTLVSSVALVAGTKAILLGSGGDVNVPDGCKILGVTVKNLNGRFLKLTVPVDTGLLIPQAEGSSTVPFGGFTKYVSAPYTKFPTLKVEVPDTLARAQDVTGTAVTLFTVSAAGSATDLIELSVLVRYLV